MHIENNSFYSHSLSRDMTFKVYGHTGQPMLVFPSSGGNYLEYEHYGMVEACRKFIQEGLIQIYTPDTIDMETWLDPSRDPVHRAKRHNDYDRYIMDELIPYIKYDTGWKSGMIATGCSIGGYHALNFFLKHPDIFNTVISLSGIYDVRLFTGEYNELDIYLNSPVDYLRNLQDEWYLNRYRESNIILCTGQGAWEEDSLRDTRLMEDVFREKDIPAWVDYWGYDVDHDWPWWRIQIQYFLENLSKSALGKGH